MEKYIEHINKISSKIDTYFDENRKDSILYLDGTGMLSTYQNTMLSILGYDRTHSFKEIHLVSGSTYALFIFLAQRSGDFLWKPEDIALWNKNIRKWHGITPGISLLKFITSKYTGIPAGRFGGNLEICKHLFSKKFLNKKLSEFSSKYNFWVFNLNKRKLMLLNSKGPYPELTVSQTISMTTSAPPVFGPHIYNNEVFIDAMYAPKFPKFKYKIFKDKEVLHLNMFKDGEKNGIHSLKIHDYPDGNKLISRDFYRLLLGKKNKEFEKITTYALFGENV